MDNNQEVKLNWFYKKICLPLILEVSPNFYTFISGIILSLSTGVFTTLALERTEVAQVMHDWHLYLSSAFYLVAGWLFLYIASKITHVQDHLKRFASEPSQNSDVSFDDAMKKLAKKREGIISAYCHSQSKTYTTIFLLLLFSLVLGTIFLALNYFL